MGFENTAGLGVRNHYGARNVDDKFGGQTSTSGLVKQLEWVFSYDDLPTPSTGEMEALIPAGAYIKSCRMMVETGFAGGTSYDIGLQEADGTEIDNDGLWDALVVADLNVANDTSDASTHGGTNSGNLVAAATATTVAGQLSVVATGTFTAGKGRIIIEYVPAAT